MAHPDMFLSITSGCTPEERIIRFVEYYLTAFHEGRKGAVAKKPYNPILGENFHCSWYVPRDRVRPLKTTVPSSAPIAPSNIPRSSQRGTDGSSRTTSDCYCVRFVAEQVSHHPPVSGFYCECKERRMCVNTHVWTKSKFMGMSVGVSMVGEGKRTCSLFQRWLILKSCFSFFLSRIRPELELVSSSHHIASEQL